MGVGAGNGAREENTTMASNNSDPIEGAIQQHLLKKLNEDLTTEQVDELAYKVQKIRDLNTES
ncbi:hypothetical protein SEA_HANNABELLA_4 [Microbacterium phage Hannabella]|uniref:Uncharacterized protein n=1 Tax=Microbacterium phage Arete TaxID=2713257 RepID=A0A6G8R122_9CAUD|nr:hypothetical protein HWD16_gp04 [Microbacterium phage Arete]QIN93887.1 hypothetical protein SEA_ARETE_4 [Microbacterium phage Arete]URM86401.1 hypothetical protein SEA_GSHELBY23_4 [Microbacterium phage Gshelby23]UVG34212.1 hypothetical protein SEA_HANNABELLA_4 [Microbacterium phage Hannabella]